MEEAEITMMDERYETKSETSDKEGENFNCAFCQINFIDKVDMMKHVEVCEAEKIEESDEEDIAQEDFSCPYCQNKISNTEDMIKHMEEH